MKSLNQFVAQFIDIEKEVALLWDSGTEMPTLVTSSEGLFKIKSDAPNKSRHTP